MDDIRAISFDCYGTLVDWESGIRTAFAALFAETAPDADKNELLELFASHEARLEAEIPIIPYFDVLRGVALAVAADIGVTISEPQAESFASSATG